MCKKFVFNFVCTDREAKKVFATEGMEIVCCLNITIKWEEDMDCLMKILMMKI
jgi:hypothetical protein